MDQIFVLLLLVVLALCVGAVLGFVSFGRTRDLRKRIAELEARLDALAARPAAAFGEAHAESAPDVAPGEAPGMPSAGQSETEPSPGEEPETEPSPIPQPGVAAPPESEPVASQTPAAARARPDLEETFGTRWTVWLGAIALAMGGIFLVRYSIDSGLLGPIGRIFAGLVFAAGLLGAGEWLRRSGLAETSAAARAAYIPGALTAAGTITAFASIYAAYVLYDLIGDTAAFLLLGAVALATLALALVHGPGLAALGFLGAFATPLLVSSEQPSYGALSVYLLAIMAATLAVARLRGWRWLAVGAVVAGLLWSLLMIVASSFGAFDSPVIAVYLALSYVLTHAVFVASAHPREPGRIELRHDLVAVALLGLFGLPVLAHVGAFGTDGAGIALMVGFGAAAFSTAYMWNAVRTLALTAIPVLLLGYTAFDATLVEVLDPVTGAARTPDLAALVTAPENDRLVVAGVALGLYFAALGLFGVLGSASRAALAVAGVSIPLGLLVLAYLRVADFDVSVAFGVAALLLAGFFAVSAEALMRRLTAGEHGVDAAIAAYAVAAFAALAAGLGMMFERGLLSVALALVVPAIALVEVARPVRALRFVALGFAAIVAARYLWDPSVAGDDLGTTPVFNWLLWGYGVPAAGFAYAAVRFGRTRQDRFVPLFEAIAVLFVALTLVMVIHHAMNGGFLRGQVASLAEQSLVSMSLLAVSIGMQWLAVRRPSVVFRTGTLVVGAIGLASAGIGLLLVHNPYVSGERIDGGAFDASLLLGYPLPAIMAFAVAALARRRPDRPHWYVVLAGGLGGLLVLAGLTLSVRAAWHSGNLALGPVFEGELYAYSAVWLAFAVAVLVSGAVIGNRRVRTLGNAALAVVVAKVFLIDTAGLGDGLRVVSFAGLGLVLLLVAFAYQKLLRRT